MDGYVLAVGVVTSSLSLGAGIWETVRRSRRPIAAPAPSTVEVVVSGKKAYLTKEQRVAVAQILNGSQTEPVAQH
jgi:hypothetical protein